MTQGILFYKYLEIYVSKSSNQIIPFTYLLVRNVRGFRSRNKVLSERCNMSTGQALIHLLFKWIMLEQKMYYNPWYEA